jgi:hypothetical protein
MTRIRSLHQFMVLFWTCYGISFLFCLFIQKTAILRSFFYSIWNLIPIAARIPITEIRMATNIFI